MLAILKSKGLWVSVLVTIIVIEVYPRVRAMVFPPKAA